MGQASRDQNFVPTLLGVSNVDGSTPVKVYADPVTHRLLVDLAGGNGTVTSVSVVTANGFAGTVADATTTPAITMETTVTGIVKGDGTAISAATAGTDYTALAFKTIAVSGQSDVVADSAADTLTLAEGSNITITTDATTDTVTIAAASGSDTITVGTTTIASGTTTRILYDNAGVLGEYTLTGTGTVVAMQTSPTFVTDATTPIIKLSATSNQAVFQSAGVTGTLTWTPTSTNKTVTFPDRTLTIDNITTSTTTNGTGFLKGNGSVISFDNSTYITGLVVGTTSIASGTTTRILYDNAGTLGEYTLTGTGTVVAMGTSPVFTTGISSPQVLATANDSGALGASGTAFSDLFLASGAVINFAAGNVTLTHSSGVLTLGGSGAATLALGTNSLTMTGSIAATGSRVTKGWFTDIESTNAPTVGGVALPTATSTTTFTNKRITPRVLSAAAYTTDTGSSINGDTQDMFIVTAQTGALKFNNPSGTPTDGQKLIITVASSTTAARALTWDTLYGATTVALPTTTDATTATLSIGFIYSSSKTLWQVVGVA